MKAIDSNFTRHFETIINLSQSLNQKKIMLSIFASLCTEMSNRVATNDYLTPSGSLTETINFHKLMNLHSLNERQNQNPCCDGCITEDMFELAPRGLSEKKIALLSTIYNIVNTMVYENKEYICSDSKAFKDLIFIYTNIV